MNCRTFSSNSSKRGKRHPHQSNTHAVRQQTDINNQVPQTRSQNNKETSAAGNQVRLASAESYPESPRGVTQTLTALASEMSSLPRDTDFKCRIRDSVP